MVRLDLAKLNECFNLSSYGLNLNVNLPLLAVVLVVAGALLHPNIGIDINDDVANRPAPELSKNFLLSIF